MDFGFDKVMYKPETIDLTTTASTPSPGTTSSATITINNIRSVVNAIH